MTTEKNERCSKCHGRGKVFKTEGFTKADMIDCNKCNGFGSYPVGSKKKQKPQKNKQYYNKYVGIDKTREVDPV